MGCAAVGAAAFVVAASPAHASSGPVPVAAVGPAAWCSIHLNGVVATGANTGQITRRFYETRNGQPASTLDRYNPGRLGFVPRGLVTDPGGAGGIPAVNSFYLGNSAAGNFYRISAVGQNSSEEVKVTATSVGTSWSAIRTLTTTGSGGSNSNYIYGLSDAGGFYRYQYGPASQAPYGRVTVGASGWQVVKTIARTRTVTLPGTTRQADVLLATTTDGKLVEYTVPLDQPAQWTRVDLKTTSWGGFKALHSGDCYNNSGAAVGRILLGVTTAGDVYLYHDKNANDGSGSDVVGYGKISSGWTEKIF
ncbi:hypothetical protein [Knoellia pratensis]